jgi:HD-GYP domain-containing protein (c-di-GMP phosphodiesterase class II)
VDHDNPRNVLQSMKQRSSARVADGFGTLAAVGATLAAGVGIWTVATRRQQKESVRLHRVMVELLLNALSSGDPATARHSRRVANLVDVLVESLRMGRREHATLRVAALLHDLGKIDDDLFPLVHSPNPLNEEQRRRINQHPCASASILEPLEPFHHGLVAIVTSHHECWNGSGYPNGIAGEEIPLGARIITIADVFDAISQPRTYHDPAPVEEVLAMIRRGAGQRFDPALVRLLDEPSVYRRFVAIAERGRREEEAASWDKE